MPRKPDPDARRKLLAAARATFAEVGLDAARIEDIARRAGYSKGAFYLHFESKTAALREVVGEFFAVMRDLTLARHEACHELRASVGSPGPEDWRDRTPCLLAWQECDHQHSVRALEALWRHRDVLHAVLGHGEGVRLGFLEELVDLSRAMLSSQIQASIDAGALRADLPADLVSELMIGMWLQLGRRMTRLGTRPDFDVWARTVDTMIIEGLAQRHPLVGDRRVNIGAA